MPKVTFKDIKQFQRETMRDLSKAIVKSKVIDVAEDDYKKARRSGINPKTGKKYKKLKQSTIKTRRYLEKYNKTHPDYKASKSNVTISGQIVDAIKFSFNKTKVTLTLMIEGKRKGYKRKDGKKIRSQNKSNRRIAEHLETAGYPVIAASKKELARIVDRITKAIRKFI